MEEMYPTEEGLGKEMIFVEPTPPANNDPPPRESREAVTSRHNRYSVDADGPADSSFTDGSTYTPSKDPYRIASPSQRSNSYFTGDHEEKKTADEAPSPINSNGKNLVHGPFERDFDKDPTQLYVMVQKKQWSSAVKRLQDEPDEARTWVSRREKDGRLRWRLLPIHAAIVFRAPENVVESLLAAYPKGAQCKDDQGMLPLHLAFRNGSTEGVVNLLLVSFPQSVDVKDRKGRIPLVLAQASTSPNKALFLQALERGPTYYAVAAAATERAAVTAEQRALFDAKLQQIRQSHHHELTKQRMDSETREQDLKLQLATMEKELEKTQETSQVLVDHVNSLEAQLTSRSDTERFLATKIATLDSNLKDANRGKEEIESTYKAQNYQLTLERNSLQSKIEQLEATIVSLQEDIKEIKADHAGKEHQWEETKTKMKSQLHGMESEWANAKANCAILDAQLKKKINTEHALASQVSALAGKLAESAAEARDSAKNFLGRIRALEDERKALRGSVKDLTKRLSTTVITLSSVSEQQAVLVKESNEYDTQMQTAVSAHAKIVADSMRQESELNTARAEREKLREMLAEQESKIDEAERERASIMSAISIQGQHMEEAKLHRANMIGKVGAMSYEVQNVLDKTLNGIPSTIDVDDDDELVDAVVKACRSEALADDDDDDEPIDEVEENVDTPANNDAKEESIPDDEEVAPTMEEAAPTKVEVEPEGEKAEDAPVEDAVSDAELSIPSLVEDMKSVTTVEEAEDPPSESTPVITNSMTVDSVQDAESLPKGWSVPEAISTDELDMVSVSSDKLSVKSPINRSNKKTMAPLDEFQEDDDDDDEHVTASFSTST